MPKGKKLNENEESKVEAGQESEEIAEETEATKKPSRKRVEREEFDKEAWKPKTKLGRDVKEGVIKTLDEILDKGIKIKEAEIVDALVPELESELLLIGQAKGKFGGGQRRIFRQTQKKTKEGNKPRFATMAVIGNRNGFVGIGIGKSKETVPAREKALRKAKLNIIKVRRGCGSWECGCKEPHTLPFNVQGKNGSSVLMLMPAPKGTGLLVEQECQKLLRFAGIKDVRSKQKRSTKTKLNLIVACFNALKKLMEVKIKQEHVDRIGVVEGMVVKK